MKACACYGDEVVTLTAWPASGLRWQEMPAADAATFALVDARTPKALRTDSTRLPQGINAYLLDFARRRSETGV